MNIEEINRKIAEMLEFTQCEEEFADPELESYKSIICDIAKSIARSAEKEEWMEICKGIKALIEYNNLAISRDLEIKREQINE